MLFLVSCGNIDKKPKLIRTESYDFNINTATQMIKEGEKIITDISCKDTVSREEFKQFSADMDHVYDGYQDVQWQYIFFSNKEIDDEHIKELHLNKNNFYPTSYHKGIEIVSAKVANTYYQDEFFNHSFLTIREEYSGKDSKLKGWYREYLYERNDEDKWVFYGFGGEMNFAEDGFTPDYLDFK
jgi:hypothetical protein